MPIEAVVPIGLLKTKYTLPSLNKQMITRRLLNHKLDEALNHKLTLLTAPAGYGKTTSVLKWLETAALPTAWLSLDAGDNDAIVFWRYFSAALCSVSNSLSHTINYVFESQELFKAKVHLSILIDFLTEFPSSALLVLDDLQHITHQEVLDDLSHLITYLPANLHLIMLSRTAPPLKLTVLGLKENLLRIRAEDLRFTSGEIYQYYQARGYFLPNEDIQKVEDYTEGWAAALVAVSLALKDERTRLQAISSFGKSNLHIEAYLAEDVFHTWTKEQQDFMIKTSIADRLSGPLCEAIADCDGNRLLQELYEQNGFLIALDDQGTWFRYHHLFRDYLRKKLGKSETAMIRNLHGRAGEWMENNGFHKEAIEHFLQGAHYKDALLLVEKQGGALLRRGEYTQVISWIERLPEQYSGNSIMILLQKTICFTKINDFKKAWQCLDSVELALKKENRSIKDLGAEYMLVQANLFLRQGEIKAALSAISEAAALGVNPVMSTNYLDFNLCDISMYRTVYHIFITILRKSRNEFHSITKNYRSLISSNPGYAPLVAGEFLYESDRLEEALPQLLSSVDEAVRANCPGSYVPAMVTLSRIRHAHGDMAGTLQIMHECEKNIGTFHQVHWSYMVKAFLTRMHLELNDEEKVDRWLKESRLSLYQEIVGTREYELIVLARVLLAKKRCQDAHLLLNRLLNFAEGLKRSHSIVEITNLLAVTALKNMKKELAGEYIEKALSIGMVEGYVRSFVDELEPMVLLLELYLERHPEENSLTAYAMKLLSRTKGAVKNSTFTAAPNEFKKLLTPTELKVLNHILNACDNSGIAAELGITVRTVKAHTGSIYRKLGVKNRLQCINTCKNNPVLFPFEDCQ